MVNQIRNIRIWSVIPALSRNRACEPDEVNLKDRGEIPAFAGMTCNMELLI
jgi:hypothetical protein